MKHRWIVALGLALPAAAHETITTKLTWTREISRLVAARCQACHRDGGPAPMPFQTWEQTRPWARAIQEEVSERRMPPWDAEKGFAEYRHEAALTPEEIRLFNDWVEGGAPKGDDKYLAPKPLQAPQWPASWRGREIDAADGFALKSSVMLVAIRPVAAEKGGLLALAELPDGRLEPLLHVPRLRLKWNRSYELAEPLVLPANTRIRVTGGAVKLGVRAPGAPVGTRPPAAR